MRLGSGEGSKRMSAPSLADPNSVLRRTPISMTRVEKRSPTTTATAIMIMAVLTRAALRFLAISAEAFSEFHPPFRRYKPRALFPQRRLAYFTITNRGLRPLGLRMFFPTGKSSERRRRTHYRLICEVDLPLGNGVRRRRIVTGI